MKKYIFIIGILLLVLTKAVAQLPPTDPNWTLKWSDNFNYNSLVQFKNVQRTAGPGVAFWSFNIWAKPDTPVDFQNKFNFLTQDGHNISFHPDTSGTHTDSSWITLTVRTNPYNTLGKTFTSTATWLNIPNTVGWKYGYIEMSYRLPDWHTTSITRTVYFGGIPLTFTDFYTNLWGLSSDFWMYDEDSAGNAPWSEIDMSENLNGYNRIESNVGYTDDANDGYYCPKKRCGNHGAWYSTHRSDDDAGDRYGQFPYVTFGGKFHTLGVDWAPDHVDFYFDGKFYRRSPNYSDKLIQVGPIISPGANDYVNSGFRVNSTTDSVYNMDINYIKVWKLKTDSCSYSIALCKIDPSTFNFKVDKSVWVTGRCATDITSGQNVTLRATDYLRIDKNFKVEKGATFNMIPTKCQ